MFIVPLQHNSDRAISLDGNCMCRMSATFKAFSFLDKVIPLFRYSAIPLFCFTNFPLGIHFLCITRCLKWERVFT